MLTALHIQDFVLIDQARLTVDAGLTALTGETGAGKSILLDALGFAVGGRLKRGAIRTGADRGSVAAVFEPHADHEVWRLLEKHDLGDAEDQIILRRTQLANGKSRAVVNDHPVSVSLLREIGQGLLEIHGQHDGHGFLSAATHRALLDEFGRLQKEAASVRDAWSSWRAADEALAALRAQQERAAAEVDYLRHAVEELRTLAPALGEEASLAARRAELMAAETVCDDLTAAAALLSEDGLEEKLGACAARLQRAHAAFEAEAAPLTAALQQLEDAQSRVAEAHIAVEDAARALAFDSEELEAVDERLFALRGAARKYGVSAEGLPEFFAKAEAAISDVDDSDLALAQKQSDAETAARQFHERAQSLSKKRREAAEALDGAVAKELAPLKLEKATFQTTIVSDEGRASADGVDMVEFVIATNPGATPGALKTIASGGELSRFVLALKAALAAKESRTVIIFDEVDAGVGGAVATAVGERLARLARDAQVLVVTHSPQVAACAAHHWRVEKSSAANETITSIVHLDEASREEEIARMLSGEAITKEARAAARSLLKGDAPARKPRRRKSA